MTFIQRKTQNASSCRDYSKTRCTQVRRKMPAMAAVNGEEVEGRDLATRSHLGLNSSKAQTELVLLTQEPEKTSRIHIFTAKTTLRGGNSAKITGSPISSLAAIPLRRSRSFCSSSARSRGLSAPSARRALGSSQPWIIRHKSSPSFLRAALTLVFALLAV